MRNTIKKRMVDRGRDDFVIYLSEILNISPTAASNKLRGITEFNENELSILIKEFELTGEELKKGLIKIDS